MGIKVLFLDESGDHNLTVIDPQYPVFVLGGIIAERDYALGEMTEQVRRFKLVLFGRDDLILRTANITRNTNGFERLKEPAFRQEFYDRINALMRTLEYKVVACAIRKDEHLARYGLAAIDPYMLSLEVLVERFCFEIGEVQGGGMIMAERRNPTLDRELELTWQHLQTAGTSFLQARTVRSRVSSLQLLDKKANIAGLQLADLVVSPIGRVVIGKAPREDFQIIEAKFRRHGTRGYHGAGLVVLPKQ